MESSKLFARIGFLAVLSTSACIAEQGSEDASREDPLLRKTRSTSSWSYRGLMPELDSPRLTVSLAGHTVHVVGLLPIGYTAPLPFHTLTQPDPAGSGRTLVHVAYPIATVGLGGVTESGLATRNPEPFDYDICGGDNRHASNDIGSFGGFPFLEYVCGHRDRDGRVRSGIAFHGPITSENHEGTSYWYLQRGPVSHACNRMLGEHVLEMAHVVGFDRGVRHTPVKVMAAFDTLGGRKIDVDYPATGWTRPAAAEAVVFPVWQAVKPRPDGSVEIQFPRWACETSRCDVMPPNVSDGLKH